MFQNVTISFIIFKTIQHVKELTHWGRVMHICVGKLTIIGSDNGLSPERCQAIIGTNAGILLIGPLGTNFSEILIEIQTFSLKKIRLKMSSAKCCSFRVGLNVLKHYSPALRGLLLCLGGDKRYAGGGPMLVKATCWGRGALSWGAGAVCWGICWGICWGAASPCWARWWGRGSQLAGMEDGGGWEDWLLPTSLFLTPGGAFQKHLWALKSKSSSDFNVV